MKILIVFCVGAATACAQTGGAVVGAGYHAFAPISVAPGQVITVFVTGVGSVTQAFSAGKPPLPTTLGGISATLSEFGNTPVPILSVNPVITCFNTGIAPQPCSTVTAVTLQIPFELHVGILGSLMPPVIAFLTTSDQMGHSATVELNPIPDQIHVLTSFDTVLGNFGHPISGGGIVTHADGTLVDASKPAGPGEELVMYVVGLGSVSSPVKTGEASPSPPVAISGMPVLTFNFQPNAQPTPATVAPFSPVAPIFTGLTPGFVGLYQINFVVPRPSSPVTPCADPRGLGPDLFAYVNTNVTVTVVGATSFDGVGICVGPVAP